MTHALEPQTVDKTTWFYEEKRGLLVIRQVHSENGYLIQTERFTIPWHMLEASMKRHKPQAHQHRRTGE